MFSEKSEFSSAKRLAIPHKVLMTIISRSAYVSLAYRHWNNRWSTDENVRRYGALGSAEGLGGNWNIEVGLLGQQEDILQVKLDQLKALLDHRCLFTDLEDFRDGPSTIEKVTSVLGQKLFMEPTPWTHLTIRENDRLACTADRTRGLSLKIRIMNLELSFQGPLDESGLMINRERVTQSAIQLYKSFDAESFSTERAWAEALYSQLNQSMASLFSVRIDLGRGRYIVVE